MSVTVVRKLGVAASTSGPEKRVMGVDPSTKTGVAVVEGTKALHASVVKSDLIGARRMQAIAAGVGLLICEFKPDVVFIEGLAYGQYGSLVEMAQIRVLLELEFLKYGVPWYVVPPTSMKQWVTGSGRADKERIARAVRERWGFSHKKEDAMEAYALAQVGRFVLGKGAMKGVARGDV